MAGRNDAAIATALEAVAQAVQQQPQAGNGEVRMLETFLRNHPPAFKGRYDPNVEEEEEEVIFKRDNKKRIDLHYKEEFLGSYSRYKVTNGVMPRVLGPTSFYLKIWVNILNIRMLLCSQDEHQNVAVFFIRMFGIHDVLHLGSSMMNV
ncbi:hypothetical protein MTR_2g033190 [Medicago truncatula]|uniref:Uncharacterized protein n=1 Tax=Medicago truncatula TaxID=3880 RepID=G7IL37_MEDTR|nr:hypothetical protein MTR_2g033190 [Medicago truncatula]